MPRVRWNLPLVALCLVTSGCGRQAPAARAPARPPAHPPSAGHTVVINMPWTLLSARGRTIHLRWIGGGCLQFDRTEAAETPRQVTIKLLVYQHLPGPGEACTADAFLAVATVQLHEPVGTRRIVHALPTP